MKIEITGQAIDRPENMSIKANLAWDYFEINNGGWVAVRVGDDTILVTDESGDAENGFVCPSEDEFVEWLEKSAQDHIDNGDWLAELLMAAGWVSPRLFDGEIVGDGNVKALEDAILSAIRYDDEMRKEDRNNGRV